MYQVDQTLGRSDAGEAEIAPPHKHILDLMVLRYMARRLHLQLREVHPFHMEQPFHTMLPERRSRPHRLVIYRPHELLRQERLTFVGFISKRQQQTEQAVIEAVKEADRQLVVEMAGNPGISSYSSLALTDALWYNLVVFGQAEYRSAIKNSVTHTLAAYTLAPQYYEWIRLHKGMMPQGLDETAMTLRNTTSYTYSRTQT